MVRVATKPLTRGSENLTDPWTTVRELYGHLQERNERAGDVGVETAEIIAADILKLEQKLGERIHWDWMLAPMAACRRVLGEDKYSVRDYLPWIVCFCGWIAFGMLSGAWFFGIVLFAAVMYGISMFNTKVRAHALSKLVVIRVMHFKEHQPDEGFPWVFSYLTVEDGRIPYSMDLSIKGITEAPSSGYLLGVFDRDNEALGYLAPGPSGGRVVIWQQCEQEVGSLISSDFEDLIRQDNALWDRTIELAEIMAKVPSIEVDLDELERQWNLIVLDDELKVSLVKAALLFLFGDKSAPRGILLKGPPGTGKSMLAGIIASSLEVPIFGLSIADIKGEVIGVSGANVRRIWTQAREKQPAIIFVDECEGAFVTRGADQGDSFSNEIVQSFLTEWDGIGATHNILVIGATNRPELIDPAILSRFTDVVELTPPKAEGRMALVESVAKQLGMDEAIPKEAYNLMDSLSGREVKNVLQHAMRFAIPGKPALRHFEMAAEKVRGKGATRTDENASWETLILPAATKQRLKTMCQMVKENEVLTSKGIPIPRSVLLFGPPGTGKTQIARTFANEAKLGFIARSTAELKGQYLGHAAGRIAQTFEAARSMSPSILFIDEIDALTSSRGDGQDQLQMEALTQLLQELDGISARAGFVFVMAATNRLDAIDDAILSRFNQKLEIGLPSLDERREILNTLLKGRPVANDIDIELLATRTEGLSGRDIREMVTVGFNRAVERTLAAGISATDCELRAVDINEPRT